MERNLVVLCDGTFKDPSDDSNVFRLKNALARPQQLVYYDAGVGITEEGNRKGLLGTAFDSLMGGAFGSGLSRNVQQAYRWVCEHYEEGDDLYLMGFSRGAYTARSVVGMIRKIGLIRPPVDHVTLREAFARYRDDHHPNCPESVEYRSKLNTLPIESVSIRFLGVWDTVGALGVPVVGPRSLIAKERWGFHDTRLSSHVKIARQALAVDEKRAAFLPTPWCAESEGSREPDAVKQVWFAGCHSDIGGRSGAIAFHWMLGEAETAGLRLNPPLADRPAPTDPQILHESLSCLYQIGVGTVGRPIREQVDGNARFLNETVSPTAFQLRKKVGTDEQGQPQYEAVPETDRENLQLQGMRGPKPGWGLTLGYYLTQYDDLCEQREPCCERYDPER